MSVDPKQRSERTSQCPTEVLEDVKKFVSNHPTFFLEELQHFLFTKWPNLKNTSLPTICRALHFDMGMTRKVITKAACECLPEEVANYRAKLATVYSYPQQMVFIDETSKDSCNAYHMHGWAGKGEKVVVQLPSGQRVRRSVLAALGHNGFIAWETTSETFTRFDFHHAFINKILPFLNPWPLPRSIVVMDNAKIHMYPELCAAISSAGTLLLFLPPYLPDLNPI